MSVDDFGTLLYRSTTSASSGYAVIGELVKISPPEIKVNKVDYTNHSSTNGYKDYRPSKSKELGEFGFTLNLSGSALASGLTTDMEDQSIDHWKLAFPTNSASSVMYFQGFITSFKVGDADAQSTKVLTCDLKVQPTGAPTWSSSI